MITLAQRGPVAVAAVAVSRGKRVFMSHILRMRTWQKVVLGALFSALFLWLALRDLDWRVVGAHLQNARWHYLPLCVGVWSASLGIRAMRWHLLLGERVPFGSVFHVHNIGFLLNNVLPFRTGELARAYLVAQTKSGVSGWSVLSTIVAERILDVLTIVLLLVMILPLLSVDPAIVSGGLLLGGLAVLGFGLLLAFAHRPQWAQAFLKLALRVLPFLARLNLASLLDRLLAGLQPLASWRGLLRIGLWSAITWFFAILEVWALALLFPDWPQTTAVQAALVLALVAASVSIIVPLTVAGVGPFEAATIFALMTANLSPERAATFAVVWHAGLVLTYALWGAIGLLVIGPSLGQVRRGAAAMSEVEPTAQEHATSQQADV